MNNDPGVPQCFVIGQPPRIDSAFLPTEVASRMCGLNTGNLVASYALCQHLNLPEVVDFGAPLSQMNRSGRVGVVQGANQLGAHFNGEQWLEPISEVEIHLAAVGVGIQGPLTGGVGSVQRWPVVDVIPQAAFDWLARVAERAPTDAPNIAVRGSHTQEVLAEQGLANRVEVIGCPSLFINPNPYLGAQIAANTGKAERVAVLAGNTSWQDLQPVEETLAKLVEETSGSYIGQHGTNIMKLTRGEAEQLSEDDLSMCRDYIKPRQTLDQFKAWCRTYGNLFFDVTAWMEHYRKFNFVIGLRLHGVVLALQAGVPALCVAHDARMLELCRTMHIPHVLPAHVEPGVSVTKLRELAMFDAAAFDANRRTLCRKYVRFLRNNGLPVARWLEDLAAPTGNVCPSVTPESLPSAPAPISADIGRARAGSTT